MSKRLGLLLFALLCLVTRSYGTECGVSVLKNCETDECAGRQVLGCESCGFMCERCKCGDPLPDPSAQQPVVDKKSECLTRCRTERAMRNKNCPPGDYQDMTRKYCLENSGETFKTCIADCDK